MPLTATGNAGGNQLRSEVKAVGSIQVSLTDADRARALCELLQRSTQTPVVCTDRPDLENACAVVLDRDSFHRLPQPLEHADRIVLITSNDATHLKEAWEAGVHSVLSEQDPLNTVVLAVLATCLRSGTRKMKPAEGRVSP